MRERPTPIIVVSSMDVKVIVKALTIGAMDFVAVTQEVDQIAQDLISKIKISAKVKPLRRITIRPVKKTQSLKQKEAFKIVAVGASTGGPQALQLLLSKLPKDFSAGILVVQHISQGFINGLTEWLRATSPLDITLAKTGDTVKTGTVYFAPDDFHMKIDNNGVISLTEDMSHKSFHVPSIDETMKSLAAAYKDNAVGVIMTGMGHDGAEGMCQIQQAGGATIAQDEKSSMIFGMNKTAIEKGCIDKIVPLERIAAELIKLTK